MNGTNRHFAVGLALILGLAAGCGGSGGSLTKSSRTETSDEQIEVSEQSATPETTARSVSTTTPVTTDDDAVALPAGAIPGLDDYDGDGEPDPTCGTQDFGAGLVLRVPCSIGTAAEVPPGTELVDGSLYRFPSFNSDAMSTVSASVLLARDADGGRVAILVFNTDGLFGLGSAELNEAQTYTLINAVNAINTDYPGSALQIRGHTDGTGSPSANQTLSEERAASVKAFFEGSGINVSSIDAVGLGQTLPLAKEINADGSDNPDARQFNRRVEIVVRY